MKIKKYLWLLGFVNLILIIIYGSVNIKISREISEVNKAFFHTQQKEILIFEIAKEVLKLENSIYQAAILGMNSQILDYYKYDINKTLKHIKKLLNILQNGGEYIQTNKTNLINKSHIKKSIVIDKADFSVEINDINTKLSLISENLQNIFYKIKKRNKNIKQNIYIKRELKLLPSIFNRIIENINRYLYLTENKLNKLKEEKKELIKTYTYTQLIFVIFAITINLLLLAYIFRDLHILYTELEYRLYYDNLTGLKNRTALEEDVKDATGLIIIDIDDFSNINEMYGTKVGDEFLVEFAKVLQKYEKNTYRMGSDEFGVVLKNDTKDIKKYAKNLLQKLTSTPIELKSVGIKIDSITLKMGIAISGDLIKNATFGLKIAKDKNTSIYKVTQKDIKEEKERIEFSMKWTQKLKEGIKNDGFYPFIHPIVDKDKNIVKYEVLMRLKDGDKYIPPLYLDIAIKTRLYHQISRTMFKKAVENLKYPISFNISYLDVANEDTKELIFTTLQKIDATKITFEILEDNTIKDFTIFNDFIQQIKKMGAQIAIDDFGTGYSNFTRILDISPDLIKIDGSLIQNITKKENQNIIKAIVSFAKDSGIKTVAEFVDSDEIFQLCIELGIDYFQGYYFSVPKPMDSV
ncbi:MAG: GGDEF and EAL domain-containing protein [Epsilonproteobacteria bacterium]|nr:GGDEF and EAL domain-containing protein [Campylobacterota bacterium]